MTARCSSCQRPIVWAVTEATGKRMPLDANDDGSLASVSGGSIALTGRTHPTSGAPIVAIERGGGSARSHFATCPQAKEHRR